MVEDATVVLLSDAHKLTHNNMRKSDELRVAQEVSLNQTWITHTITAPAHECDARACVCVCVRTRASAGFTALEEVEVESLF